jgi:alkylation response protein AidB-like acyl-CoA dehydrogenase
VAEWTHEEEEARLAEARSWQRTKSEAGWAGIAWPREYGGRGGGLIEQAIFAEEEANFDVPRDALGVGLSWCGPAVLVLGDEEQKRRFLPPLLAGEEVWCQLFSEPGAGSDLAGLSTRAERYDDEWLLTGEKVWTTFAHRSDWGLCVARHDPDQPKHGGLTAFIVDMRSPGVSARPLRQMTGAANFNQVHLDGVRVPDRLRVGAIGAGWRVVITTFMFERVGAAFAVAPILEALRPLVNGDPRRTDSYVRAYIMLRTLTFARMRMLTALSKGAGPGPEGSIGKLMGTQMLTSLYELGLESLDAGGMLAGENGRDGGDWAAAFLGAPGLRIGGGTDDIQRNIIGERLLGLPKDV